MKTKTSLKRSVQRMEEMKAAIKKAIEEEKAKRKEGTETQVPS